MEKEKKKLHSGAHWIFRIHGFIVIVFAMFFVFLVGSFTVGPMIGISPEFMSILPIIIFSDVIFSIVCAEIFARMSYNRWFYEFTNEGLQLERGIIWKRYSNVPYNRMQNIDINRGIIARLFGFSTLIVQTAGYSGVTSAEGKIPALDPIETEKIRESLIKKISNKSN